MSTADRVIVELLLTAHSSQPTGHSPLLCWLEVNAFRCAAHPCWPKTDIKPTSIMFPWNTITLHTITHTIKYKKMCNILLPYLRMCCVSSKYAVNRLPIASTKHVIPLGIEPMILYSLLPRPTGSTFMNIAHNECIDWYLFLHVLVLLSKSALYTVIFTTCSRNLISPHFVHLDYK